MNDFKSVDHLNQVFQSGRFSLPSNLTVAGIPFHRSKAISFPIPEMVEAGKKDFVIYVIDPKARESEAWQTNKKIPVEERELDEWVICIWAIDGTLSIRPARAVTNSIGRASSDLETAGRNLAEGNQITIPDTVEVGFVQFNKTSPGKVDTGANLSSLHCEQWKVLAGKKVVEFRSSLLSNNVLRMELLDQVGIKTSEGSEYRPVISLDITIAGKALKGCKFNLNDRSQMQDKILLGQNVLEKGQFLVDPNKQQDRMESVDWDALQEEYKDVTVPEVPLHENDKAIDALYQSMIDSDVTMSELAHHILVQEK